MMACLFMSFIICFILMPDTRVQYKWSKVELSTGDFQMSWVALTAFVCCFQRAHYILFVAET